LGAFFALIALVDGEHINPYWKRDLVQSCLPKYQPAVLADAQVLAVQPDVAHAGHVAPCVRDCGKWGRLPKVVGGNRAFDLVVLHVGRFDVDQAYLASGVLQWLVNEITGDASISESPHVEEQAFDGRGLYVERVTKGPVPALSCCGGVSCEVV
jgi:hypothetical protein